MTVYVFEYNPCIFESEFGIMSIHKTKRGAYDSMRNFLLDKYWDEYNMYEMYGKRKDNRSHAWRAIQPYERCRISRKIILE